MPRAWRLPFCRSPRRRKAAGPSASARSMSRLMSAMAMFWSARLLEFECIFKFALPSAVRRKRKAFGAVFSLGVKRQKLVRHVLERFADARLARGPAGAAEPVERWLSAFDDAVALHQVHALQRHVEARVVGVAQAA